AEGPTYNPSAVTFGDTGNVQYATTKAPSLTTPVQIRNTDIRFSQNSAILENVVASVGQSNATGALTLKNFAAPQVQFTLNADKVNVAELQQMMAATPTKRADASHSFWSVIPAANAEPAATEPNMLTKMTGGGAVNI